MALEYFIPPVLPSPGTKRKPEVKTLLAEFGDGYTSETRDGINNVRQVLSLQWDTLLPAQADAIEQFFMRHGGVDPFWYTPSNSTVQQKWTCKEWDRTEGQLHAMSATFRQCFNLLT